MYIGISDVMCYRDGYASTGLSSDAVHTGVGGKLLECVRLRFRWLGVERYQRTRKNVSESV